MNQQSQHNRNNGDISNIAASNGFFGSNINGGSTDTANGINAPQDSSHASLKPSENIKFLEEQLGIDLGGWQSPTATARDDIMGNCIIDNVTTARTARAIANEVDTVVQPGSANIDDVNNNGNGNGKQSDNDESDTATQINETQKTVPAQRIKAFQNYGKYAKEIKHAVKNAPHNAKVRMRWIGIITIAIVGIGVATASVIIPANARNDRITVVSAIKEYASDEGNNPTVSGFVKYASNDGIKHGTELEIASWRDNAKSLKEDSISVSTDGSNQYVSYSLDDATVNTKIAVNDDGTKKVKSVEISLNEVTSPLSDGVKDGTPTETDGMDMQKVNLETADDMDVSLINGFSFHCPDGFTESYKSDVDDGASTIDRKYSMDGNGEISVNTSAADAHPDSIPDKRQAEILRNAWNKTVAASASAADRQADRDTQFAGYTIDFGNGAFGYVSEYATSTQDGSSQKVEARILVTKGDKKATITYTKDGSSDAVSIDVIMKMIRIHTDK